MSFNTGTYVYFDPSAGALTAANNGLAVDGGNTVQWGGDLIKTTVINGKTFDWSFTAEDAGSDRNVLAWDQSSAQLAFGEEASNYPITGTWYLSPTNQAGYLTFRTYDAPDTAARIGVDANNYSQLQLFNGSRVMGFEAARTGADTWQVTLGDADNQSGIIVIQKWNGEAALQVYRSGTLRGQISAIGGIYANEGIFHDTSQALIAYGGDSGEPGLLMGSLGTRGLELHNNVSIGGVVKNRLQLGCADFLPGITMLAVNFDGSPVAASAVTNTHNLPIEINGTTYYIMLSNTR